MAVDLARFGEAGLDESQLEKVPFGRSRFLALLGGALTAGAMRLFAPAAASAGPGPVLMPYMCWGAPPCECCQGFRCCGQNCIPHLGCTGVTSCWFACNEVNHNLYMCCDYAWAGNDPLTLRCMCQQLVQRGVCNPA